MDESNVGAKPDPKDLTPRPPVEADLAALCRELNQRGARYVVIGGFAIIAAGLPRMTGDIDLMVAVDPENEARIFSALSTLPDNAVRELQPGELQQYNVIRVADEILVDLMRSAGGIEYEDAVVLRQHARHFGVATLWNVATNHSGEKGDGPPLPNPLLQRRRGRTSRPLLAPARCVTEDRRTPRRCREVQGSLAPPAHVLDITTAPPPLFCPFGGRYPKKRRIIQTFAP